MPLRGRGLPQAGDSSTLSWERVGVASGADRGLLMLPRLQPLCPPLLASLLASSLLKVSSKWKSNAVPHLKYCSALCTLGIKAKLRKMSFGVLYNLIPPYSSGSGNKTKEMDFNQNKQREVQGLKGVGAG